MRPLPCRWGKYIWPLSDTLTAVPYTNQNAPVLWQPRAPTHHVARERIINVSSLEGLGILVAVTLSTEGTAFCMPTLDRQCPKVLPDPHKTHGGG